jgi:glycosyltransferase involved in cell wall biosynthesis
MERVPKVSVVIPTHNRTERLSRAIRSVLAQTEQDFEIIVVDDGSPLRAAEDIVRAFADPRLTCVRLPTSRGPGAARNAGIERARAPYVAFLDDDDEWLPEKLTAQLDVLERSPERVGGVYTARITVDEVAGTVVTTWCKQTTFDPYSCENAITTSSIVVRRACFGVVGVFDEMLFSGQDFDMWIRLGQTYDLICLQKPLVKYVVHDGYRITDDEVQKIQAQEMLIAKHRQIFGRNRRGYSELYRALGARYLRVGHKERARAAFREAMRLWPFEPRTYWAILRAWFREQPVLAALAKRRESA